MFDSLAILSKHTIWILFLIIGLQLFHIWKKFESSTRYNNTNKARDISGEKKNMEDSFENQATQSHKGERIKSYTLKFKLQAVMYADLHGNRFVGRKFNVDVWCIREWRKKKEKNHKTEQEITRKGKKNFRRCWSETCPCICWEQSPWIDLWLLWKKNLRVSYILIMKKL